MIGKSFILVFAFAAIVCADSRINFIYYHDGTTTEYSTDTLPQVLSHPSFRRTAETVAFHYGAGQNLGSSEVSDIINSYISNARYNLIVVHYFSMESIHTDNAVALSDSLATAFTRFFDTGYNSGFMNFVAHGLGAQIMARASRLIQSRSNFRHVIGRLTGLDPASMGPVATIQIGRLSSADAQFVETIHTDGTLNGDHLSFGHVSFFPNGGENQPFCTNPVPPLRANCNSVFSLTMWAESVRAVSQIFPSLQCDTWPRYTAGVCNNNHVAHLGRITDNNLRGTYFLRTNDAPPFNRETPFP
ncbi:unnamed protein product [Chironomus riparius]|uniref:Lipase domain-containing protein n=1 Tax=Chironomus riparius TaxID=315576 RepID=A0A9N9RRZ2_9DIPT|nr:unnamed protein product [Chironomus riparius]